MKEDEMPLISVCFSGGGIRAMVSTKMFLDELCHIGLTDALAHVIGVSGSTWCLGMWGSYEINPFYPDMDDPWKAKINEESTCEMNVSEEKEEKVENQKSCMDLEEKDEGEQILASAETSGRKGEMDKALMALLSPKRSGQISGWGLDRFLSPVLEWMLDQDVSKLVGTLFGKTATTLITHANIISILGTLITKDAVVEVDLLYQWRQFLAKFLLPSGIPIPDFSSKNKILKDRLMTGQLPLIICCGIARNPGKDKELRPYNTVEFSPFEVSYVSGDYVDSVPSELFGSKFTNLGLIDHHFHFDHHHKPSSPLFLPNVMATCGSAFAFDYKSASSALNVLYPIFGTSIIPKSARTDLNVGFIETNGLVRNNLITLKNSTYIVPRFQNLAELPSEGGNGNGAEGSVASEDTSGILNPKKP